MNQDKKPNILFILTDEMRADAMGCTGGYVNTPNLDRIASEGVLFSNCSTNSPVCMPARVSLASGLYPHNTGLWNNTPIFSDACFYQMPVNYRTWMSAIHDAGYRTSLFGKTHLSTHIAGSDYRLKEDIMHQYGIDDVHEIAGPISDGWVDSHMTSYWKKKGLLDEFRKDAKRRWGDGKGKYWEVKPSPLPLEDYYDTYIGQRAKEYIENYDMDKPWFCWVSFGGPHLYWDTPEPYASMYDPAKMPKPLKSVMKRGKYSGNNLDRIDEGSIDFKPGEVAKMRANYAGGVTLIDDQIGEILKVLEKRGELDNTVIAFISDHGEMNGDYNLAQKCLFWESALKIPCMVRTPETISNINLQGKSNTLVELMDIGPTLAEYAGAEIDYPNFARSLVPVISGEQKIHRKSVLSEFTEELMLLTEKWKFTVNKEGHPYFLVDMINDPGETTNLVSEPQYRELVGELQTQLLRRVLDSQLN